MAIGLLVGFGIAHATFVSDSASGTHNGCLYTGYASIDPGGAGGGQAGTASACAAETSVSAYFVNPNTGEIVQASAGSYASRVVIIDLGNGASIVWGYHRVQEPLGSWSLPLETQAR